MIKEAIVKIVNKEDLTYDEAYTVMNEIMSGKTTATQNAAFLAALSTKSAELKRPMRSQGVRRLCGNMQPGLKPKWNFLKSLEQEATTPKALISQQLLRSLRLQAA